MVVSNFKPDAQSALAEPAPQPYQQIEPVLQIHEIQGNSLAGFSKDHEMLLFLEITDVCLAKQWLTEIEPHIATVAEVLTFNRLFKETRRRRHREGTVRSTFMNIGFSYPGLQKLTPDADQFTDESFKAGLHNRSAALGDPLNPAALGHPNNWVIGGAHNVPDVIVLIASDDQPRLDAEVKWLLANLPEGAFKLLYKQRGATLPGALAGHEHFGFKDGVSQPGIRGRLSDRPEDFLTLREKPEENPNQGKPGQDLLHAGEFIFGYPTQIGEPDRDTNGNEIDGLNLKPGAIATAGPTWANNGSYLVFRRLQQDVPGFHKFLKTAAAAIAAQNSSFANMTPEKFGAKLVGRWASGAPILKSPDQDNPDLATDVDFEFEQLDKQGFVCPFAGHIRKAYPRDTERNFGVNESATQTHRLLRRGAPYGKPASASGGCPMRKLSSWSGLQSLVTQLVDTLIAKVYPEQNDRGLLFLAYQTSIERQFEFVSGAWVNNPNFSDPNAGHDAILGQNNEDESRERFINLQSPNGETKVPLMTDWVTPTGGGYFFTPSISALKYLAGAIED
jgi:Dyp-type peroxidase family